MNARATRNEVTPSGRPVVPHVAVVVCLVGAAIGLPACNAPQYEGMPIEEFVQIVEEEETQLQREREMAPVTTQPASTAGAYRVGPADVLEFTIYGLDSLEAPTVVPARVDGSGAVALPLAGAIPVADLTLPEIERRVADAYSPDYIREPRVLVDIKEYQQTDVLVIGQFMGSRGTRRVSLRRDERGLLQALAKAEVVTTNASTRVFVQPAANPYALEEYDLSNPNDVLRAMSRSPLEEQDIVVARSTPEPLIFVTGLAGGGAYPMPETGLRLRQAIALAGGVPTEFDADKVVLTRRLLDGRDVVVVFKWKELAVGNQPDVDLRPGDVIEIPHTAETRTEEFLRRALVLRAGINAVWDPIQQWVRPAWYEDDDNDWTIRKALMYDAALRTSHAVTAPVLGR
jgi:protein involved in polysaccharide export with SLBB domain